MSKRILMILAPALLLAAAAKAQTVTTTVPVGAGPGAVAVNPVTNKIYVTNSNSNNVTVIDGATNTTITVPAGMVAGGVSVNTLTNKIYVGNIVGNTVTVIDGATNTTTTVPSGANPDALAINPLTNKIYVANQTDGTVTVIDGATNSTTTLTAGTNPLPAALNPVTNKIYVGNNHSGNVTVIDGATNATALVATGISPDSIAVNAATNKIYVSNFFSNSVTVIDGATNSTATVAVGTNPVCVALNPVTNQIYVANTNSNDVTVIDGATNTTTTVAAGTLPQTVVVNSVTNTIFVTNQTSNNVTVIDGATNNTVTLAVGTAPNGLAVNPVTNKIYVTNSGSNNVTVIDGATNAPATVAAGSSPFFAAVNPATNQIYVPNSGSNNVTVIDGTTNATTTVAAGTAPFSVAVNPVTNKIYVGNNGSANVTVIDGATNATTTVAAGSNPNAVAVNPVTNKIYVANGQSANVTVIDGATNATTNVPVGLGPNPNSVAVNPVTNKIYVANNGSNNVTVIDGATNNTTTVAAGTNPFGVAVNAVTNRIYVGNSGGNNVTVIDGATNNTTTVAAGTAPVDVAVNPVTNKIYVANFGSANVTVIDGATNNTTTVATGTGPNFVAVNPVTNKIYVANKTSNNVTVIDGATNTTATVTNGNGLAPFAVAVNPVTNQIYAANNGSSNVTVITEQQVQPIPLTTTITPLAGNQTTNPTPTFTFTTSSSFAPTAPPVDALYFQFDTWQGPWTAATSAGGGGFTGTAPTLSLGTHILYAYATDGQDASSIMTTIFGGSTPVTGAISAYLFDVVNQVSAPIVSLSPNPAAFGNQNVNTPSATLPVTLSNTGNATLNLTNVSGLGGNNPGDFAVLNTTTCATGANVVANGSCVLNVTFTPSATGARSATIMFTDNAADSPETLTLTGTGTAASGGLTIVTTSLPNGTLNGAYGQTLQVTGGVQPFAFSITSGTLPAGLNLTTTSGSIGGVPTGTTGTSSFTVKVTDSSSPTPQTATANLSITINAADATNNSELNGHYAFLFSGFKDNGGTMEVVAASFTADGQGNITNGIADDDDATGAQPSQSFTGTYTLGADNRGTMSLTTQSGTVVLAFSVGDIQSGVATKARLIRFDDVSGTNGHTGSGVMFQQDPTAFTLGSIKGNYAFGDSGSDTKNGIVESGVGVVTSDGNGNFTTGLIDLDGAGSLVTSAVITGTYTTAANTASNGRFPATFTIAGVPGTFSDILYVISANQAIFISLNSTANSLTVLSGAAQLQVPPAGGFGLGSVSGNSVVAIQGQLSAATTSVEIGAANADGDGNFAFAFDQNKAGTFVNGTASGTYTVASNGRAVFTFTTSTVGAINPAIAYLDGLNQGFLASTDGASSFGSLEPGGSGFSNATLNTGFFFGTIGPARNQAGDTSGTGSFDGNGTIQATTDESDPGGILVGDQANSQPYAVASNGRLTITGQNHTIVGYVASGCSFKTISSSGSNPGIVVGECQALATAPQVSLSTTSLTFPATNVADTSSVQTVTVTNTGNANLVFSALTPTGDFAVVVAGSVNPTCAIATPLTPTSKCDISVVFTPTAAGTRNGTLSIADNAANSPQVVTLTGTGIAVGPNITITPSSTVNFGNQRVGTTSNAITTTVTNSGNQAITLTTVTLSPLPNGPAGTNPDGFTIVANNLDCGNGKNLAAGGGSCILPVTFGPLAAGAVSSTITLTDSLGSQVITLNGTGTVPTISLNPPSLSFSTAPGTTSAAQTVTLTNSGGATLNIANVSLGGKDVADFAFVNGANPCAKGTAVPSQGTCTIGVDFSAPSQATFNATVTVTSDASNGVQSIPLVGTGVVITITPPSGGTTTATVNPGGTAVFPLVLTSTGISGTATLSCSSPQASITCTVVPGSVVLTPNGTTNAAIVVNSFCTRMSPPASASRNIPPAPWLIAIAGLAILASMALTKKRSLRLAMPLAALLLIQVFASSCGSPPKGPAGATPPGVYTLNITATVGQSSGSVALTLIVN